MYFDYQLLIRLMICNYFPLFYRFPSYCMFLCAKVFKLDVLPFACFCRSGPVFRLEYEQILKGRRMAGNGGGEVILIGIWCCLSSSEGQGHLPRPACPHPQLPVQVPETNQLG